MGPRHGAICQKHGTWRPMSAGHIPMTVDARVRVCRERRCVENVSVERWNLVDAEHFYLGPNAASLWNRRNRKTCRLNRREVISMNGVLASLPNEVANAEREYIEAWRRKTGRADGRE